MLTDIQPLNLCTVCFLPQQIICIEFLRSSFHSKVGNLVGWLKNSSLELKVCLLQKNEWPTNLSGVNTHFDHQRVNRRNPSVNWVTQPVLKITLLLSQFGSVPENTLVLFPVWVFNKSLSQHDKSNNEPFYFNIYIFLTLFCNPAYCI